MAPAGVEDSPRSLLGVLWKLVVFQEFGVRTQSQHLRVRDQRDGYETQSALTEDVLLQSYKNLWNSPFNKTLQVSA